MEFKSKPLCPEEYKFIVDENGQFLCVYQEHGGESKGKYCDPVYSDEKNCLTRSCRYDDQYLSMDNSGVPRCGKPGWQSEYINDVPWLSDIKEEVVPEE